MALRLSVISEQMILDIVQGKDIGGVFSVGNELSGAKTRTLGTPALRGIGGECVESVVKT